MERRAKSGGSNEIGPDEAVKDRIQKDEASLAEHTAVSTGE